MTFGYVEVVQSN